MELWTRRFWIFDLDGTLTHAVHDFAALRQRLGLAPGTPLLEVLDEVPPQEAERIRAGIAAWEWEMAEEAVAAPDALSLVKALLAHGRTVGILTRNRRDIGLRTLAVAGMLDLFDEQAVLGRDEAAPKPAPDGISRLLSHWGADPGDAVMVGDYLFDLQAGRAAGTATVYIDRAGEALWNAEADRVVRALDELLPVESDLTDPHK